VKEGYSCCVTFDAQKVLHVLCLRHARASWCNFHEALEDTRRSSSLHTCSKYSTKDAWIYILHVACREKSFLFMVTQSIPMLREQEAQHSPVVPLGFSEFLTRVRETAISAHTSGTCTIDQSKWKYASQRVVLPEPQSHPPRTPPPFS
jgi:hypothetical protein